MALQTQNWNPAVGIAAAHPSVGPALAALHAGAQAEVSNAIGQLTAIFGGLGPTNVVNVHGWRIDRQNAPTGFVNLSVQRNGVVGAPSTVASVFVPVALNVGPGPGGPLVQPHPARMSELERSVRRGLEESFASWVAGPPAVITRREVFGTYSA